MSALRLVVALLPLALVPLLGRAIAAGRIDLGGGERDLVWVLPAGLWAVLFAAASAAARRRPLSRSVALAAGIATAGVLAAACALAALGKLGVGGRF